MAAILDTICTALGYVCIYAGAGALSLALVRLVNRLDGAR